MKEGFADEDKKVPAYLYLAFAAGAIYFFLAFFEIGMEIDWIEGDSVDSNAFIGVKIGTFLTYAAFIYGWIRLESFIPNKILKIALWTMLGANVILYGVDFVSLVGGQFSIEDYYLIKLSAFGLCYAFLGVGYLAYKNLWSHIPQVVGAVGLVAGILIFSGIGVLFGLIPLMIFEIGQLGLMVWGINKIGRTSSPDSTFSTEFQA